MTRWAALVDTNAPLPEYPRPQMVRSNWENLNGVWQFQPGATNDSVPTGQTLANQILVPYPMESAISGVMKYSEFSWYRRTFTVPATWSASTSFCTWTLWTGRPPSMSTVGNWACTKAVMIRSATTSRLI